MQHNGSIRACWTFTRAAMWRSFWSNAGGKTAASLPTSSRLSLVKRTVTPQLSYRCSRWPPQKQIADELDRVQQKMISIALRQPRLPHEEVQDYVRRRGRAARRICQKHGPWSNHWFARAAALYKHLSRSRNGTVWSAQLRDYHGKKWLEEQRASFIVSETSSTSILAGRTGTRAFVGKVHTRWHDGVEYAAARL